MGGCEVAHCFFAYFFNSKILCNFVLISIEKLFLMEDIGDLLYVVVILIAGLGAVIKSFKKKQEKEIVSSSPSPQFPDLSDIFPAMDTYSERVSTDVSPAVLHEIAKQQQSTKPQYQAVKKKHEVNPVEDERDSNYVDFDMDLHDADELKKAFIYSEIFNRKYN